ncbi:XisI protein [Anaerolineales bacterium HSG25]|nr:XisI protein [Anaerolineales bacterium HSG25]
MDKLAKYRQLIKQLLLDHESLINRSRWQPNLETHALCDETRDRYMIFETGWWGPKRVHSTTIYVRLYKNKVYIEEDWTEDGITPVLMNAGIPREDIVLAFHPPEMRQHTEFAIA